MERELKWWNNHNYEENISLLLLLYIIILLLHYEENRNIKSWDMSHAHVIKFCLKIINRYLCSNDQTNKIKYYTLSLIRR